MSWLSLLKWLDMNQTENSSTRRRWSGRTVGTRLGYNIFFLLIRIGGRWLAYFAVHSVVIYYILCRPAIRYRAHPYLRHRFPEGSWLKRKMDCYRLFVQMGKTLVDRTVVGINGSHRIKLTLDGRETLLKLLGEERGFILLMSHVGGWQVALPALDFLKVQVNLLLERREDDVDWQYYEHAGITCPFRIIDPTGYLGGTLEMLNVLKNGEVLCMMGDRVLGSEKNYLKVPFIGEEAPFPFSPFKIASAVQVPIVVFFSYKTGYNSYTLKVAKVIRVPNKLGRSGEVFLPFVAQFAEELESFTMKHPYQFFNFYDMWQ